MDFVIRLAAEDAGGFTITFDKKRLAKPDEYKLYEPLTASLTGQGWEFSDAPKTKPNKRGSDRVRMERHYAQAINDLSLDIEKPNHKGHDGKPVCAVTLRERERQVERLR